MRKFLKPSNASIPVPKPNGEMLAAMGEDVRVDAYWHRRLADGSVIEVAPDKPVQPTATERLNAVLLGSETAASASETVAKKPAPRRSRNSKEKV